MKFRQHTIRIFDLIRSEGYFLNTDKFIAQKAGVSRKTVTRAIRELREAGLIRTSTVRWKRDGWWGCQRTIELTS